MDTYRHAGARAHTQTHTHTHTHTHKPPPHTHTHTHTHIVWPFQCRYRNSHSQSSRSVFVNQSHARFWFQVRPYFIYKCLKCQITGSYKGDNKVPSFRVTTPCSLVQSYQCINLHGDKSCKKEVLNVSQSCVRAVQFCSILSCQLCYVRLILYKPVAESIFFVLIT